MDAERSMTKSELIELIAAKQSHLPAKDVELAVKQDRTADAIETARASVEKNPEAVFPRLLLASLLSRSGK